jgi:exosome complex exonuclease RRP6
MDDSQDFSSFQEKISSKLVDTTKVVNRLHSQDLSFYRSLDPTISAALDKQSARLLGLAECLLKTAVSGMEVEAPDVKEIDELDNNWNGIVEVVDSLFERADMCLDEYTGAIKKPNVVEEEVGPHTPVPAYIWLIYQAAVSRPLPPKRNPVNVLHTRNDLPKPQLLFRRKPLNDADGPFKPLLTTKPHAVLPLVQSFGTTLDENGNEQYEDNTYPCPHPERQRVKEGIF